MFYFSLRMCHGFKHMIEELPIKLELNETALYASLLISCLLGFGLMLQGATGIKGCNNHTAIRAKRHLSRARKCLIFFTILYVAKIFVDVGLVSDIGESLEDQLDRVNEIIGEHNKYMDDPHIIVRYNNGTTLFAPDNTKCLPNGQAFFGMPVVDPIIPPIPNIDPEINIMQPYHEPRQNTNINPEINIEKPYYEPRNVENSTTIAEPAITDVNNETERALWKKHDSGDFFDFESEDSEDREHHESRHERKKREKRERKERKRRDKMRHDYDTPDFDMPIYFCPQENTLVLQIDMIRGHISEMMIGVYAIATIINLIGLLVICGCIMCCNRRYKEACDQMQNVPAPPQPQQQNAQHVAPAREVNLSQESQIEMIPYHNDH